jgi:hypothetical protein
MITEPTLSIESKGKDAIKVKNNLHVIFATNNDWSVPAGPKERRFFVVDVGEKHLQDHQYFGKLIDQMNNGGREALLHYLLNYDVSKLNLRKFTHTDALLEQKLYSLSPGQKFWHYVLQRGCLYSDSKKGWDDGKIETKKLYDEFKEFVNDMGIRHKPSDTEFGIHLKKLLPEGIEYKKKCALVTSDRKSCYVFPSIVECRKGFEKFIDYKINWSTE